MKINLKWCIRCPKLTTIQSGKVASILTNKLVYQTQITPEWLHISYCGPVYNITVKGMSVNGSVLLTSVWTWLVLNKTTKQKYHIGHHDKKEHQHESLLYSDLSLINLSSHTVGGVISLCLRTTTNLKKNVSLLKQTCLHNTRILWMIVK